MVWWHRARRADQSAVVGTAAPARNNTTSENSLLLYCCASCACSAPWYYYHTPYSNRDRSSGAPGQNQIHRDLDTSGESLKKSLQGSWTLCCPETAGTQALKWRIVAGPSSPVFPQAAAITFSNDMQTIIYLPLSSGPSLSTPKQ